MSNVKKMLGVVMAAMLCFALTPIAAFASPAADGSAPNGNVGNTKGVITITNAVPEQEYSVYEIFQLESYNNDAKAYSYKLVSDAWKPFFAAGAAGASYVTINDKGYVTWKEDADAAALAKEAIKFAEENGIEATKTETAGAASEGSKTVRLQFTGLELGYYLVSSAVGTICSLDSTHNKVDITDKNKEPGVVKQVQEDSDGSWGQSNNADIGQVVNFQSTITGQAGARNYVFHDEMTKGLTFQPDTLVVKHGDETLAIDDDYQLLANETATANVFEVVFSKDVCDSIKKDDTIVLTYSAVLNENAVISGGSNDNEAKLSYGNSDNSITTPGSTTKTYTGGINVFKRNDAKEGLAGAVFVLSKSADEADFLKNAFSFVQLPADDERADANVPTYRLATGADEDPVSTIVTDATGKFKIIGLDVDTYYLHETKAPDGYNKLATAQEVKVTKGETGVVDFGDADVVNKTGLELPSTGGIGTTIFYIIGGILVVGAIAFLIVRRRSSSTK